MSPASAAPVGVFDSGVGGLSVLDALRSELPHEHFVYFADIGHAPYGERGDAYVIERSRAVVQALRASHGIKALVVACNTATAAAIHLLRAEHPELPIVGLEPALKPAAAASRTGEIAVLATRGTVQGRKLAALRDALAGQANFRLVPCDGLAKAIDDADTEAIAALAARYMADAGPLGVQPGEADVVVIGCTHYTFALEALRRHAPAGVRFIDTGVPVSQHTRRLLAAAGTLAEAGNGGITLLGSGDPAVLEAAAARWLSPAQPHALPA